MARGKTHVQTYLENDTADAFEEYKVAHDIETNAEAGRRLLRSALEQEADQSIPWVRSHVLTLASNLTLLALAAYISGQTTALLPPREATMLSWVLFGLAGGTVGVGVLLEELAKTHSQMTLPRQIQAVIASTIPVDPENQPHSEENADPDSEVVGDD